MDNKEFYTSLNGLKYSEDEIYEYENINNLTDQDLSRISGAVKIRYGLDGIKRFSKNVNDQLDEGEKIEKAIKVRDIQMIYLATLLSSTGVLTFKSNDIPIFNTLFFTNRRVFFGYSNYLNENLYSGWIENDSILGIKFTNKKVKVIKKSENIDRYKVKLSRWTFGTIASELWILGSIIGILICSGSPEVGFYVFLLLNSLLLRVALAFQHRYLDKFYIIFNNGSPLQCLIASDDYFKCKAYLMKISKRYKI